MLWLSLLLQLIFSRSVSYLGNQTGECIDMAYASQEN